jgi:catechol 2,3-dioxygenase
MTIRHRGIRRLGFVRLAVDDLDTALNFAQNVIGLLPHIAGGSDRAMLRCWHEAQAYSYILERGAPGLIEIGLQVRDDDDLNKAAARVQAAEVDVAEAPAERLPGLGRSIAFTVPDGPRLRLYADQDTPGFVTAGNGGVDWNVPRSLRGTQAPLYLTHVGVTSHNPQAVIDFLTDTLDFGVSELITTDDGTHTLSALLFRTNHGQDIAIYPGTESRLHHVAFAKEDETDILRDTTWLRQENVRIDMYGPTRQSYGRTFSVHFWDPCGIRYEMCAGGRFSELHRDYRPVRWTESHLDRALSFYDSIENKEFLDPSL